MSLSAMASSMTGSGSGSGGNSVFASTGSLSSDAAALSSAFDKRAPSEPEVNWGSSPLTEDRVVPVRVAPIPPEQPEAPAQADSSLESSYATLYASRPAPKPTQALSQQNSYLA